MPFSLQPFTQKIGHIPARLCRLRIPSQLNRGSWEASSVQLLSDERRPHAVMVGHQGHAVRPVHHKGELDDRRLRRGREEQGQQHDDRQVDEVGPVGRVRHVPPAAARLVQVAQEKS